ncbi:MAG: trigger factor [Bacteriovoracaceae bacterium]
MSYTIQNINSCTKKLMFNFDKIDLTKEINAALVKKQSTANLKGFRAGKAPLEMIKKFYGPQVENEALYQFVSSQYLEAVKKENIKAVGYPSFDNTKYEAGKTVSFEAIVEIFPEFELKDFSSFSFKKEDTKVTENDLEDFKNRYLSAKSQMKEVTDASATLKKANFAAINFQGEKADGSKPENMKAEDFLLEIGSGQFIPGFEDALIGMKKGDTKTFTVTFPADYHETELQNSPVKFTAELLEIKEKVLPEFNDELAKEFGFTSVADFNEKNKKTLAYQKERQASEKLNQEFLEKIIKENLFDVPSALVEQQKTAVQNDLKNNLKGQGFNEQMIEAYFEKWDNDITTKALFQVRSGLILDNLAKKNNIEATEADFEKKIMEMVEQSGMEKAQVEKYYNSNVNVKKNMMYAIREEKTFTTILSKLKIS